ncbi:transporter [Cupriavidus pinatubonensis]|uniref:Transporter n=1 Tax=Cupriavidus pinatubonensis TaxID=248026 RepID=A0ABM8Y3Y0_9BURK|nr:transporter [Cupriavidus pinatubonensis]CAG9187478.1 hypothetical protein LMG23994_06923 [Cupriavidus pinatubonensis]
MLMPTSPWKKRNWCLLIALCTSTAVVDAQELEPRAYSAAPVGTNYLLASYSLLSGVVMTDPSLPVSNIEARINSFAAGYVRVFGLAGRTASVGLLAPFANANVSGNVFDAPTEVHRAGLGDLRLRLAVNLYGSTALTPDEFARQPPSTTVGASLTAVAPTGQYDPSHLINIGTNRWAFKPEIGLSQPFGNWFTEVSAGVWFFADNNAFLGNQRRRQAPLAVLQLHGGYTFRPSFWLAGDVGFYTGGNTTVNGVANQDRQQNSRYGITLSLPVVPGWSAKLGASKGLITRAGGDYKAIILTIQHQWFD